MDALHGVAARRQFLDLTRVAIRGWSFGGYLAALAVLRRPDVFHVGVAGAPVTEWRLYDTHYTERYLGIDPDGADREAYDRSSLLPEAEELSRPLLIIHGLADDNVVVANTLQLSQRLTEAGCLHSVLPLSGITHMTPQEAVAEHLVTRAAGLHPAGARDRRPQLANDRLCFRSVRSPTSSNSPRRGLRGDTDDPEPGNVRAPGGP